MDSLIAKTAVSWLSLVFAPVSAISDTVDNVHSAMDTILFEKLEYVLRNQRMAKSLSCHGKGIERRRC